MEKEVNESLDDVLENRGAAFFERMISSNLDGKRIAEKSVEAIVHMGSLSKFDVKSAINAAEAIGQFGARDILEASYVARFFKTHEGEDAYLPDFIPMLALWWNHGCPILSLTQSQAANICLTEINEEIASETMPPWDTFLVKVDGGICETEDGTVGHIFVSRPDRIVFGADENTWSYVAPVGSRVLWRLRQRSYKMASSFDPDFLRPDEGPLVQPITSQDERATKLITSLCVGSCLAMSEFGSVEKQPQSKKEKKNGVSKYRLNSTVTVDFSKHVRDYVSGVVTKHRTSRWIVRGHWRNQPYGPELSKKKILWIKPHWSGAVTGERVESKEYRIAQ